MLTSQDLEMTAKAPTNVSNEGRDASILFPGQEGSRLTEARRNSNFWVILRSSSLSVWRARPASESLMLSRQAGAANSTPAAYEMPWKSMANQMSVDDFASEPRLAEFTELNTASIELAPGASKTMRGTRALNIVTPDTWFQAQAR